MRQETYPITLFGFLSVLSVLSFFFAGVTSIQVGFLLGGHILLHWFAFRLPWVLYGILQSMLLMLIPGLSGNTSLVVTLTAWLIGESVAIPASRVRRIVVPVWFLALGIVVIVFLEDSSGAMNWLTAAVPTMFFVLLIMMMYARESRARRTAEELTRELADANRLVAEYARTTERERMARDLHDTLAQGVAGIVLQVEAAVSRQSRGDHAEVTNILNRVLEQARTTLRESRDRIQDLRSGDLIVHQTDIVNRLQELVNRNAVSNGACVVTFSQSVLPTDRLVLRDSRLREVESIVHEALANARAHAHATHVSVSLSYADEALEVRVEDNGAGFDTETRNEPGHYGILGMQERAMQSGATVSVQSTPGRGTTVALSIPCDRQAERV